MGRNARPAREAWYSKVVAVQCIPDTLHPTYLDAVWHLRNREQELRQRCRDSDRYRLRPVLSFSNEERRKANGRMWKRVTDRRGRNLQG